MRENPLKQCVELAEEARVILEVITASSAAAAALKHWGKPAATADLNQQRFSYDGVRVCKASSTGFLYSHKLSLSFGSPCDFIMWL